MPALIACIEAYSFSARLLQKLRSTGGQHDRQHKISTEQTNTAGSAQDIQEMPSSGNSPANRQSIESSGSSSDVERSGISAPLPSDQPTLHRVTRAEHRVKPKAGKIRLKRGTSNLNSRGKRASRCFRRSERRLYYAEPIVIASSISRTAASSPIKIDREMM